MIHSALGRILKKLELSRGLPPDSVQWHQLLDQLDQLLKSGDADRSLLERSLEISSQEMKLLYEELKVTSANKINIEHSKLLAVMDSLSDGLLVLDEQGHVLDANRAAKSATGLPLEELAGIHLLELVELRQGEDQRLGKSVLDQILSEGQVYRDDNGLLFCGQSTPLPVSSVLSPIHSNDEKRGAVYLFRDVSRQKQVETELRRAQQQAVSANNEKDRFLATMSHEIRTPMNGIIGTLSLLEDTPLNAQQQELVGILKQSSDLQLSVINDILDFSRLEAGKMLVDEVEFSLREFVQGLESIYRGTINSKFIIFCCSVEDGLEDRYFGDSLRIKQILLNYLNNALKFTPEGGHIFFSVEMDPDVSGNLRFTVKDTGIGIPADRIKSLFEPFTQVDSSTTRQYGGSGLGLAICRRMAELLNGSVGVSSCENEGSAFWLSCPLQTLANRRADVFESNTTGAVDETRMVAERQPLSAHILIVDDNLVNQKVAAKMVSRFGFTADLAENGEQAIALFSSKKYAMILMDCQMPVMDGYEATVRIRELEEQKPKSAGSATPIIAMTANVMKQEQQRCLAVGMDEVLAKPVKLAHLDDLFKRWL